MIETTLLLQLIAFADYGTLSEAAARLHTSQPALTRAMKKLETELGVPLFLRSKNHIALNDTGHVAVDYARRAIQGIEDFTSHVRAYDRSQHTISIGYCAPVPQTVLTPLINSLFDGMTISADMKDDRDFLARLDDGTYQLAVVHEIPQGEAYLAKKCGHEKLYLSVPAGSPLAFYPEIRLQDLDGLSILLFARIGFWMRLVEEKSPDAHYLLQVQRNAFLELVQHSAYPCFSSSHFLKHGSALPDRVPIPLAAPDGETNYYLVCRQENANRFRRLFDEIHETTIQ